MSFGFLSELAEILTETTLNKKNIIVLPQKPASTDKTPSVKQSVEQGESLAEQPVIQTAPAGSSKDEQKANKQTRPVSFELNSSNIIQAVIYSELLNEPVCKRRRRWRNWS